jgi:HAD superfamily hydrolase (TIGR01509 family)
LCGIKVLNLQKIKYYHFMNKFKGALFDLDGVIIDTEPTYTEFWGAVGRKYNVGGDDFAHVIKGNTLGNILGQWFPNKDIQADIVVALKKHEAEMQYTAFDGVIGFIANLHNAGVRTAIVTSSNGVKMQHVREQLPELFKHIDAVLTEENVTRSKPDPQGYILAAEALGCKPEDCYVFEDSLAGLEAGRRSGAKVVGVATTNPHNVIAQHCDVVVDNTADFKMN